MFSKYMLLLKQICLKMLLLKFLNIRWVHIQIGICRNWYVLLGMIILMLNTINKNWELSRIQSNNANIVAFVVCVLAARLPEV